MSPPAPTPSSETSEWVESFKRMMDERDLKSREQAQELERALSDVRQARNQKDKVLDSLEAIKHEHASCKKELETWKVSMDQANLMIQNYRVKIAELKSERTKWMDECCRVEKSCQMWKGEFERVEEELIRLEQSMAEKDSFQGNLNGLLLDECARYDEHGTSPPSSSISTKIGSASIENPPVKRRQLDTVVVPTTNRSQKTSGPRQSAGKPPAGGTKVQTKTVKNPSRPAKGKGTPNQKPSQNTEGSTMPIKVEDEEDDFDPVNDRKGKVPSDKNHKSSMAIKKASKPVEPSPLCMDDDATPPAPRRRKSGTDREYHELDEDENVRRRPPPRRKSIRGLRESDFEYFEDEEEAGEDSAVDMPNLGHSARVEKSAGRQRANQKSSLPARTTGKKRKAEDTMDVDDPVVSGRGAGKAVKTR